MVRLIVIKSCIRKMQLNFLLMTMLMVIIPITDMILKSLTGKKWRNLNLKGNILSFKV